MNDEELKDKWEEGFVLLTEIGGYINSDPGISDYGNAVKVLAAIEKFEDIVKVMQAERRSKKMFGINFKQVTGYVDYLKKSAIETKNSYA